MNQFPLLSRLDNDLAEVSKTVVAADEVKAAVISDRIGRPPGNLGGSTGAPPTRLLREVIVRADSIAMFFLSDASRQ